MGQLNIIEVDAFTAGPVKGSNSNIQDVLFSFLAEDSEKGERVYVAFQYTKELNKKEEVDGMVVTSIIDDVEDYFTSYAKAGYKDFKFRVRAFRNWGHAIKYCASIKQIKKQPNARILVPR